MMMDTAKMILQLLALTSLGMASCRRQSASTLPPNYEALGGGEKEEILWSQIQRSEYSLDELPTRNWNPITSLNLLRPSFNAKSFTWDHDEIMKGRPPRLIHTYGSVAKVELQISQDSPYTGCFAPGYQHIGLARFSLARQDYSNYIPGFALKFLNDGHTSSNIIAMYSVDGQGSNTNFFEKVFSNFIPDPTGIATKALTFAFRGALEELPGGQCDRPEAETKLPLLTPASVHPDGSLVNSPHAPLFLKFRPNPDLGWDPRSQEDLRVHLTKIPLGSVLYTVEAYEAAEAEGQVIGQLVLRSKFVPSKYGDEVLYFVHHPKRC